MAGLGGLEEGWRREGEEVQELLSNCPPPPSLPHPPSFPTRRSCCLTAPLPHIQKKHLIRSSYSSSFKGTLNDVLFFFFFYEGGGVVACCISRKKKHSVLGHDIQIYSHFMMRPSSDMSVFEGENVVFSRSPLSSALMPKGVAWGGSRQEVGGIRVWQGEVLKERVGCNCSDRF